MASDPKGSAAPDASERGAPRSAFLGEVFARVNFPLLVNQRSPEQQLAEPLVCYRCFLLGISLNHDKAGPARGSGDDLGERFDVARFRHSSYSPRVHEYKEDIEARDYLRESIATLDRHALVLSTHAPSASGGGGGGGAAGAAPSAKASGGAGAAASTAAAVGLETTSDCPYGRVGLVPFNVQGDGNCLLHSASVGSLGAEKLFHAMRQAIQREMAEHKDHYVALLGDGYLEDVYKNDVADCYPAHPDAVSKPLGDIHCAALSNVLLRPIVMLWASPEQNQLFLPTRRTPEECLVDGETPSPLIVGWTSSAQGHYCSVVRLQHSMWSTQFVSVGRRRPMRPWLEGRPAFAVPFLLLRNICLTLHLSDYRSALSSIMTCLRAIQQIISEALSRAPLLNSFEMSIPSWLTLECRDHIAALFQTLGCHLDLARTSQTRIVFFAPAELLSNARFIHKVELMSQVVELERADLARELEKGRGDEVLDRTVARTRAFVPFEHERACFGGIFGAAEIGLTWEAAHAYAHPNGWELGGPVYDEALVHGVLAEMKRAFEVCLGMTFADALMSESLLTCIACSRTQQARAGIDGGPRRTFQFCELCDTVLFDPTSPFTNRNRVLATAYNVKGGGPSWPCSQCAYVNDGFVELCATSDCPGRRPPPAPSADVTAAVADVAPPGRPSPVTSADSSEAELAAAIALSKGAAPDVGLDAAGGDEDSEDGELNAAIALSQTAAHDTDELPPPIPPTLAFSISDGSDDSTAELAAALALSQAPQQAAIVQDSLNPTDVSAYGTVPAEEIARLEASLSNEDEEHAEAAEAGAASVASTGVPQAGDAAPASEAGDDSGRDPKRPRVDTRAPGLWSDVPLAEAYAAIRAARRVFGTRGGALSRASSAPGRPQSARPVASVTAAAAGVADAGRPPVAPQPRRSDDHGGRVQDTVAASLVRSVSEGRGGEPPVQQLVAPSAPLPPVDPLQLLRSLSDVARDEARARMPREAARSTVTAQATGSGATDTVRPGDALDIDT